MLLYNIDTYGIKNILYVVDMIINFYVGHNNEFSIYEKDGLYLKENINGYAQANLPLKNIISNINLAFFLKQNNLLDIKDKYLYYIKDNIDEVVNHLNERNMIAKFANKNGQFVRKYLKRRDKNDY